MVWIAERECYGSRSSISAGQALELLQHVLDETQVVVDHRFYRAAGAPEPPIFDDYEDFARR